MNAFESLQRSIVTAWNADSDLSSLNGLYFTRGKENVDYPYAVFFLDSNTNGARTFSDSSRDFSIQFNVFSSKKSSSEINTVMEYIYTEFDSKEFTMAGGYKNTLLRRGTESIFKNDSNNWQGTISYFTNIY